MNEARLSVAPARRPLAAAAEDLALPASPRRLCVYSHRRLEASRLALRQRSSLAACRPSRWQRPTVSVSQQDHQARWIRHHLRRQPLGRRLAYIPTADQAADYLTKACPGVLVRRFQSALDGSCRDNAGSVVATTAASPPGAVGTGLNGRSPFSSSLSPPTNQPIMAHLTTHLHL